MCPMCLAAGGLYLAGGVSAGAATTFLATRLLRKRPAPATSTPSPRTGGREHAATDDRIQG
jgi:hypothetical protein